MRHQPKGLTILYEDRDILVVDKAAGLLSIATESDNIRTAYHRLTDYVRKGCRKSAERIYVVHRLDRETSGVLLFARTEQAKRQLQERWEDAEKTYLAIVHGRMAKHTDTISSYLAENAAQRVYSTPNHALGRLSHTAYLVLQETKEFSLLDIRLLTGRKNQIRVHLSECGHPVVGDRKYGHKHDSHRPLALHARSIAFDHPINGRRLTVIAPVPAHFPLLLGGPTVIPSQR